MDRRLRAQGRCPEPGRLLPHQGGRLRFDGHRAHVLIRPKLDPKRRVEQHRFPLLQGSLAKKSRSSRYDAGRMTGNPKDEGQATAVHPLHAPIARGPTRTYVVRVVTGAGAGKTFIIDSSRDGRVLLGQSPACAVQLEDQAVSRRHAALDVERGGLRVTDLDSTN